MNPVIQQAIQRLKDLGDDKTATLVSLAYDLGKTDGMEVLPQELKDAYEAERWVL